jgi:hypothetical protein
MRRERSAGGFGRGVIRRLLIAALPLLAACAAGPDVPRPLGPSTRRITATELASVRAGDLLDAIQLLRPSWIPRRDPGSVDVYLGRERMTGGTLELRSLRTSEVDAVEYVTLADAQFRMADAQRPVIVVLLKH